MGLYLTGINDAAVAASGAPYAATAGQSVPVTVTVGNTGGSAGAFTLSGQTVRADDGTTHEGNLWSGQGGTGSQTASGIAPAGGQASVTLWTGPIATQDQFSPPLAALTMLLTLTDATTGVANYYSVASAIALPATTASTGGSTGGAAAFGFGSPTSATLPIGGTMTVAGASVSVAAGVWWTLTVQAIDATGTVLGQTEVTGAGPQAGFGYNVGPLNEAGASIHLSGSLALYGNSARTAPLTGSPVTASSGIVATTASPSVPTQAPSLSGSVNQQTGLVTLSWGAVQYATDYELQSTSGAAITGGNGTIASDIDGGTGFFQSATVWTGTMAPGSMSVRVRGTSGIGPSAAAGPWSNTVTVTVTGTPSIVVASVSASSLSAFTQTYGSGQTETIAAIQATLQVSNEGTAAGSFDGWSAVVVGPDGNVYATTSDGGPFELAAGASTSFGTSLALYYGAAANGYYTPGPAGTYTVWAALGQGYVQAGYYTGSYVQPFRGAVPGSVSATAYYGG